jgi:hypothetical protein
LAAIFHPRTFDFQQPDSAKHLLGCLYFGCNFCDNILFIESFSGITGLKVHQVKSL